MLICPECKYPIKPNIKFCGKCGKQLVNLCPECKYPIKPNTKFCGKCGKQLVNLCPECKYPIKPNTKFCGHCGKPLSAPNPGQGYRQVYAINLINDIKKILSASETRKQRYSGDLEWLDKWQKSWLTDKIRVGVIGITSSGKSTLINAILGDDLLSMAVMPSSSQLVSCSYAEKRNAVVYYLDGRKIINDDNDKLKEFIIQHSDESFNINNEKQVMQIELSTPGFDLGEDVLLVDSPGLDAAGYEIHEKLTLETLLPTIDVVIFVTSAKSEIDRKMKQTLDIIAKYNCPVMIVQNMLDSIRPSIDGKKSAEDVAEERINRVRLAVEQSDLQNKKEVRIAQISAIYAMKYRCKKNTNEEASQNFKKSRYEDFISGVKELIEYNRPVIENQRIKTIVEHIKELINLENKNVDKIKELNKTQNYFTAVLDKIDNLREKISSEINRGCDSLQPYKSYSYFDSDDIAEIEKVSKNFETVIIKNINNFNNECYKAIRELNLPARDMWSYNGLPRSMPKAEVIKNNVPKSRTVDKKGFVSGVARFFDYFFFNGEKGWGTEKEHYTVKVVDKTATRNSVLAYIERLQKEYGKTLRRWSQNADSTISSIQQEINSRIDAIKIKEHQTFDTAEWEKIRNDLNKYIYVWKDGYSSALCSLNEHAQKQEMQEDAKDIKANSNNIELINASEKYFPIQKSVLKDALKSQGRDNYPALIISGSSDNLSDFLYLFYRIKKTDFIKEPICHISDNLTVACQPSEAQVETIQNSSPGRNVFLLVNGLQFHTNPETKLRKAILKNLRQNDTLFFVLHDFEILANGNAISESIRTIKDEIKQNQHKGLILISHENPVYNMAMIYSQLNEIKIKEETEYYFSLTEKFPDLINEVVKNRLNKIIRTSLHE